MPSLFVVIPSLPALAGTARDLLFAYSPAAVGAAYGFHLSSRLGIPAFLPVRAVEGSRLDFDAGNYTETRICHAPNGANGCLAVFPAQPMIG